MPKIISMKNVQLAIIMLSVLIAPKSFGQLQKTDTLYATILAQDSLLFNMGFNACDIKQFDSILSDDFEFYHDKGGFSNKKKFLSDVLSGLCKNVIPFSTRVLVKEKTEIYPLFQNNVLYGAIQNGEHLFYETGLGLQSCAKFSHLWILENSKWKLKTGLSFDHQSITKEIPGNPIFDNDTIIENWLKNNKVPALAIGVIDDGKLKQIKVFGTIAKGNTTPYNAIFNVASLTKPVTAIVALKLISVGKWSLDDPVDKYWTDADVVNDPRSKILTTRHILSHQTGFPNWRWVNNPDEKLTFQFTPGTKYQYSGEGFEYLRKALEHKFHKGINQLADELIFKPLRLKDTKYIWDKDVDISRYAVGYDKDEKPYKIEKYTSPSGADNLLTTIEDYSKFLISILNSDGISKKVFDEMTKNQVLSDRGKHFGLGFEIYDLGNGETAISHGGSDKGAQTIFFLLPKTKQGLVIFTNSDNGMNLYEEIIKNYLGKNGQKIIDIETK